MLATDFCCDEEPVFSVMCSLSLVGGRTVPLVASIVLPLGVAPLMTCFLAAIVDVEEIF